jgi:hypothetical protein
LAETRTKFTRQLHQNKVSFHSMVTFRSPRDLDATELHCITGPEPQANCKQARRFEKDTWGGIGDTKALHHPPGTVHARAALARADLPAHACAALARAARRAPAATGSRHLSNHRCVLALRSDRCQPHPFIGLCLPAALCARAFASICPRPSRGLLRPSSAVAPPASSPAIRPHSHHERPVLCRAWHRDRTKHSFRRRSASASCPPHVSSPTCPHVPSPRVPTCPPQVQLVRHQPFRLCVSAHSPHFSLWAAAAAAAFCWLSRCRVSALGNSTGAGGALATIRR